MLKENKIKIRLAYKDARTLEKDGGGPLFALATTYFGIKYQCREDVEHLNKIMQEKYTFKVDFDAKQYIGIQLDWDYETRELRCSMKGYVQEALKELEYIATSQRHYNAPSQIARPDYGATIQYVKEDTGTSLTPSAIKHIERVVGKFLYYGRAIDDTMLHAIGDIASNTSKATTTTQKAVQYFLDYANSNPDAEILYRASDMILQTDSDAAYLVNTIS